MFANEEVSAAAERLREEGMVSLEENDTTCCYARADKVWAREPDGLQWEWYRVKEDVEEFGAEPKFVPASETPTGTPGRCC